MEFDQLTAFQPYLKLLLRFRFATRMAGSGTCIRALDFAIGTVWNLKAPRGQEKNPASAPTYLVGLLSFAAMDLIRSSRLLLSNVDPKCRFWNIYGDFAMGLLRNGNNPKFIDAANSEMNLRSW
jgi:hypothetical protein